MSYECFELTLSEGIAHIRFNRPEKSQLDDSILLDRIAECC